MITLKQFCFLPHPAYENSGYAVAARKGDLQKKKNRFFLTRIYKTGRDS